MNDNVDKAQKVRSEDQLDLTKLSDYLANNFKGFTADDSLSLKQFSGGASNLTYQLSWGKQQVVLRTAPRGANIKSAHDMSREYKVLSLLRPHFHYAPKALHLCEDESVIGREFYLMEKIDGIIPRKTFPMPVNPTQAHAICKQLIDVHVALHEVDIKATGLIELGHPKGYIGRQISGWNKRYKNALVEDSLSADALMRWLESNQPEDKDTCLIHNDYKLDNVVLSAEKPTQIIAVLDWEMTTVGSPLMDLGCSLAYWIQKDDSPYMQAISMMPTMLDGMMTRDEIVQYYAEKRNIVVDDFDYFYVFGLFRLAVIVQQIYKRYALGKTTNPAFKNFGELVKILIRQAESFI